MLSARALRKHQNELLDIKADLKMLEKQNEGTLVTINACTCVGVRVRVRVRVR
jgi:hypothetical protein